MPARTTNTPQTLRPYLFHGLDLDWSEGRKEALGDCPWCGKEGKFSVEISSGLWRCFSCNEGSNNAKGIVHGGNSYSFLRLLHRYSQEKKHVFKEKQLEALANHRHLLSIQTLTDWGITASFLGKNCLVPGYGDPSRLCQLYRYSKIKDKKGQWNYRLLATPQHGVKSSDNEEIYHTLLGLQLWEESKDTVYVCEGPWDALALWEVLKRCKRSDSGRLVLTANAGISLLAEANVVAVPGCTTFAKKWCKWFRGKKVCLLFDNDHSRLVNGRDAGRNGFLGMQNVARLLMQSNTPPAAIHYLAWGEDGYDKELPDGYDVRDLLAPAAETVLPKRLEGLARLLEKVRPIPDDWLGKKKVMTATAGNYGHEAKVCQSYEEVENAWKKAARWRQNLSDCLASMLAVCLSNDQVGSQLFLQLIGEAGSLKTKMCEALLVSPHCYPVEKVKGFFSGWRGGVDDEGNEVDYSLIDRVNHKTLITAEGDLLMSLPNAGEIMSEARRFFDGSATSSYKSRKEDKHYTGRRTPWIIAGTPALMNRCQAHLGDRFLRIRIDRPDANEQWHILMRAAYASARNTLYISNGDAGKTLSPEMHEAYQATGGFVNYLRGNVETLLGKVQDPEWSLIACAKLAQFTAMLRARPDPDPNSEAVCREEATRLTEQYVRLARNLAAVFGKTRLDEEVMRVVRKVAIDTAWGRTYDICQLAYHWGDGGFEPLNLCKETGNDLKKENRLLIFLHRIGVLEPFTYKIAEGVSGKQRWRLSPVLRELWETVAVNKKSRLAARKG